MTANQINYAKLKEEGRHNLRTEAQQDIALAHQGTQARAAISQAETAAGRLVEDSRHNREQERVNWWNAQTQATETARHNKEEEGIGWFNAKSKDVLNTAQAQAAIRGVGAQERQAGAAERQAAVAEGRLGVERQQLQINARHASAAEQQARASLMSAGAAQTQASAAWRNALTNDFAAKEQQRTNLAKETAARQSLGETVRHNVQSEKVAKQDSQSRQTSAYAQSASARASSRRAEASYKDAETREKELILKGASAASSGFAKFASLIAGGVL